jgi:hypothetical protein
MMQNEGMRMDTRDNKKAMEGFPAAVGWGAPSLKPEFPQNFLKERIES